MDGMRTLRSPAYAEVRYRLGLAESDAVKSAVWLRAAACHSHAGAHRTMGQRLREGIGVEKDVPAAMLSVYKAANLGDMEGQFMLGHYLEFGDGLPQSSREALRWYREAAHQRYQPAEAALAQILHVFAAGEDSEAQFELAQLYSTGRGVEGGPNDGECARWMETSASRGHTMAMFKLAAMYDLGIGCTESGEEAVKWCREAAVRGHAKAQFKLGELFRTGRGVTQDSAMAGKWFLQAAEGGVVEAQFNVATMYRSGKGLKKSSGEATRFMALAASAGHEQAIRRLKRWKDNSGK